MLVDPANVIPEYSEGNNHGSLQYALGAIAVSITVGSDGVTLFWNKNWGQVYTVMVSTNLEEWIPCEGYEGILSTRDVDGSEFNAVTIPFQDEASFFKRRIDQL